MLLTEWNIDDALAVAREEGEERGLERGLEQGREDVRLMILELLDQGLSADEIRQQIKK